MTATRLALAIGVLLLATSASAERITELNGRHVQLHPPKGNGAGASSKGKPTANVTYHNGPVIKRAKVVPILWGPASTWGTSTTRSVLAQHIIDFFAQFGTNPQYNVITQYYDTGGSIQLGALTTSYVIDNSTPPTNVTDAAIQAEVAKIVGQIGADAATVYEVFLPPTSYASYGSANSCGGPNLQFCAYHSNFTASGVDVKYASMPYPSCNGCRWTGWTDAQNFDHFSSHETREAVTDPDGTAWFDHQGYEADDKCAWSPSPFLVNGFGYQYEWSNLQSGCVTSR
jgi:hypothetical protein